MKRNKHHGLNVEFDGLCMDFGHVSLNKKKEFLCGDCYKIEENDEDHVLVLSDGLGSGVKANILSTLTATMLSTMIINQVELDEAVRAVAKTLPVCSVRNLAYATFTVLNFQGKQVSLYQFDNPDAILIRDGRLFDYPVETSMIEEKEIHKSCFELKDEDMLIIMSDGVTNAGMGKTTNGGWGRDDVMAFCRAKYHKGMSAQEMAGYLAEASLDLNLNETDDDITAIVLRMRHKQVVNLMIGPPSKEEHDERYLKSFFDSEGYHVICGGTTAQCAARYLDKELISLSETACGDVPAYYKLEGTELVTEGFLTIEHLLKRILSEKRCSYITCDCHHWYGIHVCGSDSCYQIGSSGAGSCKTHADFTGSSCVSVCCMGCSLLMGGQYMCDLVFIFIEGVIYIQDGTARISEYSVNALFF